MKPVTSKAARDAEAIAGDRESWQLGEVRIDTLFVAQEVSPFRPH